MIKDISLFIFRGRVPFFLEYHKFMDFKNICYVLINCSDFFFLDAQVISFCSLGFLSSWLLCIHIEKRACHKRIPMNFHKLTISMLSAISSRYGTSWKHSCPINFLTLLFGTNRMPQAPLVHFISQSKYQPFQVALVLFGS